MTTGGQREQQEREVLATLLLRAFAYKELPEGFSEEAFEFREYRDLFVRFREMFIDTGQPANAIALGKTFAELAEVILEVNYVAKILNGEFKGKAVGLLCHRPPPSYTQEAITTETRFGKNNEQFRFDLLNGRDILNMEIQPEAYLVKGLISETSLTFLSGEEGCGKSILAMNLAISVAVGAPQWLGYEVVKNGKVLYLNNEMAFSDFGRRFKSMSSSLPAPGDISNLIAPKEVPPLQQCWDALNELCWIEKPCLVVLDCLYFAHDEDENDSSSMKALMRQLIVIREKYHLALLLVHHTKKGARFERMHNDQMRGSNVFSGASDTVLQIRRSAADETKRIIKPTKFRHVSDDNRKCHLLSLNPETLWFRDEGETDEADHTANTAGATAADEIDFKQVFKRGEPFSRKEVLQRCSPLGYDERTIDRLLRKAKVEGNLTVPKYGYYALPNFDTSTTP